jgi:hypothetical protein
MIVTRMMAGIDENGENRSRQGDHSFAAPGQGGALSFTFNARTTESPLRDKSTKTPRMGHAAEAEHLHRSRHHHADG